MEANFVHEEIVEYPKLSVSLKINLLLMFHVCCFIFAVSYSIANNQNHIILNYIIVIT